ncbi:hypothetical protein AB0L06_43395 [Spirillospora sp. NPDC052269]
MTDPGHQADSHRPRPNPDPDPGGTPDLSDFDTAHFGASVGPESGPGRQAEVRLVHNPGDDVIVTRHLTAIHDVAAGQVVVLPAPDRCSTGAAGDRARRIRLAMDVLLALGKRLPRRPRRGNDADLTELWRDIEAWLRAENTRELIIDRAHELRNHELHLLADLAARCQARLWLIWAIRRLKPGDLGHLPVQPATVAEFLTTVGKPRHRRTRPRAWPPLPSADFTTFLAECRHRLDPADFTRVNRLYTATYRRAADQSNPGRWARPQHTSTLGRHHLLKLTADLRDDLIGPATDPAQALIRLRATQAAYLYSGQLYLRWRPETLGAHPARRLLSDLTPHIAAALRGWSRVEVAAATALALYFGRPPGMHSGWHTDLRLGDLAPDGSWLRMSRDSLLNTLDPAPLPGNDQPGHQAPRYLPIDYTAVVPAHLQPILAALHTHTSARDPAPDSLLFPDTGPTTLHDLIAQLQRVLHLPDTTDPNRYQHRIPNSTWLNRRGLSLHVLPPTPEMATDWNYSHHDSPA